MSGSNMVVMYGGAPDFWTPNEVPSGRQDPVYVPAATSGTQYRIEVPSAPVRLRVQVVVEADGTVRLKVHAGDRLVVETGGRGSINIETELP